MPNPLPRTPAESFAAILRWLGGAVDGHSMWGRLPRPLGLLILERLRAINRQFARIAGRVGACRSFPPRRATRRLLTARKPRRANPLPHGFAWLVRLVPEAAAYGSQLRFLFDDPAMVALLATAPAPMRRPLRSLCRRLGVDPPPILARPVLARAPANPPAESPAAARPAPPPPGEPEPPRPSSPPGIAAACGPPLPHPA